MGYKSSSSANTGGATTLVITAPTGIADGDKIWAFINVNVESTTITPPTGFKLKKYVGKSGVTSARFALFVKTASGESGNYTFTFGSSQRASGALVLVDGFREMPHIVGAFGATTGTTVTAPGITTTVDNCLLLFFASFDSGTSCTYTPPSGMTEAQDTNSSSPLTAAYEQLGAAGSTGTRSATASVDPTGTAVSLLVALMPSVGTELTLQPDGTDGKDARINQNAATTNDGSGNSLAVGDDTTDANLERTLIQFDLSSIPAGSTIHRAALTLTLLNDADFRSSNNRTIRVYRMIRAWVEAQATWNIAATATNWGTAGASNTTSDREATDIGTYPMVTTEMIDNQITFNLDKTAFAALLSSGGFTNNGFLIKIDTETNDRHFFYSSDNATAAKRPILTVEYSLNNALVDVIGVGLVPTTR